MEIAVPEKNKIPGVCYTVNDDGIELPVVDITHPAFQFIITAAELAEIEERTLRSLNSSSKMPAFLLKYYARRSIVMRGTMQAIGGYLSGMATYLQKIGPDNLGRGYAGRNDRQMLASAAPVSVRIRLRNMARGTVDGLASDLATEDRRPLHLVNIGGGTAIDSLNALILMRREHPQWLERRSVHIHVLDIDTVGPGFGARALAALTAPGGPLAGTDVSFAHTKYDWTDPAPLAELIAGLRNENAVIAGSSEGGLFEYGTDDDIIANLNALGEMVVVGSIIGDGRLSRVIKDVSRMTIQIRPPEEFEAVVRRAGWTVTTMVADNPLYAVVTLQKP